LGDDFSIALRRENRGGMNQDKTDDEKREKKMRGESPKK